ncbi:MAG: long-chain N-acyl amino acid synthase [Betaproteobacteria bacterium]|nr:MAG: long-chain N-acyl amino acid synthase [Betaproteobacteria bacterium]
MKKTVKTIVGKLRGGERPAARKTTSKKTKPRFPLDFPTFANTDVTGQTIFGDRPLRFRTLTLSEVDLKLLEHASGIEGAFKIRLAKLPGATREAGVLVERRYSGRGYQIPAAQRDPSLFTFLGYDEGQIVGTVGVRLDSPRGLSADDLYQQEIDTLRVAGQRVCEFTRLAVDTATASKPVLVGVFHTAYLYAAVVSGFTHTVIEVNPRHVSYYKRALKFDQIGPERMNRRVMAPAVLLCAAFTSIADGVARFAGRPDVPGAKTSLFLYGFSPKDEHGVLQRLRALVAQTLPEWVDAPS